MTAFELRSAASLIRERAEAARSVYAAGQEVPWHSEASLSLEWDVEDAGHIAGMSPAVALAVADWLDEVADIRRVIADLSVHTNGDPTDGSDCFLNMESKALAVATAYLNP